jgi:hypothetical protein
MSYDFFIRTDKGTTTQGEYIKGGVGVCETKSKGGGGEVSHIH